MLHFSQPPADGVECPVCGAATVMHDVVDFNKNCEEARQHFLPLSGRPIYYNRCAECAFVFAPEFSGWSDQDFQTHIYNERYIDIDPDYVSKRPLANTGFLQQLFGEGRQAIRHLDYGGGSGVLAKALTDKGWNSTSYDPFPRNEQDIGALGKFNLISAFEVFEHVPDVNDLMRNLTSLMENECVVVFTTLLSDRHIAANQRLTWWYAAPRNGHISLFSKRSLVLLAEQHGLQFGSFNGGTHCLFNRLPDFAKKLLGA
jgi:rubredoxin